MPEAHKAHEMFDIPQREFGRQEYYQMSDERRKNVPDNDTQHSRSGGHFDEDQFESEERYRRRKKRRDEARMNTILLGAVAALLVVIIVLLVLNIAKKDGGAQPQTTPAAQTQTAADDKTKADDTKTDTAGADTSEAAATTPAGEPPVIEGVTDKTIHVGDTISYMEGVTVRNPEGTDGPVELEVDNSQVDLNTPGVYTVVYIATGAGTTRLEAKVTVLEKETAPPAQISENQKTLNSYSRQILKKILTDDMSDMEKLGRIYDWVRFECDYKDDSDKSSWVNAALEMIDTRKGDCFSYFAVAKALLENAGYETVDVEKSNIEHSRHYWSLVKIADGWYHFDTTPRHGDGDYFCMVTDKQLEDYSKEHEDSHIWDKSKYPEVSTKVITDMGAEDGNVPVYKLNY